MQTTIFSDTGDRVVLDPNDAIGTGGEGSVFPKPRDPKNVIKVYENPTTEHDQKLRAFLKKNFRLPATFAAPTALWYGRNGNVIGYEMPYFKGTKPFRQLANPKFRTAHGLHNSQIAKLHLNQAGSLVLGHQQGCVFGDLNDLNSLFADLTAFFIDIDSLQFDNWPCPVATENFLDPNLYGIDLHLKPVFRPENDWYSFAVMLFRSLLIAHPYGGTNPSIDELTARAMQHSTVFDKGVIYPAVGLPPELLNDELSQVFHRYFKEGWRGTFPQDVLQKFQSELIQCPSCHSDFPRARRACPVCKAQNQVVTSVSIPGSVVLRQLLSLKGQVLFSKLDGDTVILIVLEGKDAVLYLLDSKTSQRIPLFPFIPGMHFEASHTLLAVNKDQSEELDLYEIKQGRINFVETPIADIYAATSNAVFRISGKYLFRMIGGHLIQSELQGGKLLSRILRPTIDKNSWFTVSADPDPTCIGFYRVLRQQSFWLYRSSYSTDINLPQLQPGERLVDLSVKFSSTSILILRKTRIKGTDFTHLDLLDKNGKVLSSKVVETASLPGESIHGLAFSGKALVFPTDAGVLRYDPESGSTTAFTATKNIVNSRQSLFAYQSGLLVLDTNTIGYLTLN